MAAIKRNGGLFLVMILVISHLVCCTDGLLIKGALGPTQSMTAKVEAIVNEVMKGIKSRMALIKDLQSVLEPTPHPVAYRAELLDEGTNYFVKMKVKIGEWDQFFIVKIFKPGYWKADTTAILEDHLSTFGMTAKTPIEFF